MHFKHSLNFLWCVSRLIVFDKYLSFTSPGLVIYLFFPHCLSWYTVTLFKLLNQVKHLWNNWKCRKNTNSSLTSKFFSPLWWTRRQFGMQFFHIHSIIWLSTSEESFTYGILFTHRVIEERFKSLLPNVCFCVSFTISKITLVLNHLGMIYLKYCQNMCITVTIIII